MGRNTDSPDPDWGQGYTTDPDQETLDYWEYVKEVLTEVSPGLYVSGYPNGNVLAQMRKVDISLVVSLTLKEPPPMRIPVYRYPFVDSALEIDLPIVNVATEQVVHHLAKNQGGVLVHCAYGLNRSPFVAALALVEHLGITGQEAIERIRAKRSHTLHNPSYVKHLLTRQSA